MRRCGYRGVGSEYWHRVTRPLILARDLWRCYYCGRAANWDGGAAQVDHMVERRRGGSNDPSNLVACCGPCNRGRDAAQMSADEWRAAMAARFLKSFSPQDASLGPISPSITPVRGEMSR